jgi:hypothetical protein
MSPHFGEVAEGLLEEALVRLWMVLMSLFLPKAFSVF